MARCPSLLAVPFLFLSCSAPPAPLARMSEAGGLEVAWLDLEPPPGRPPVLLMNMVHIGASEFFAAAQERLDAASVVLIEGIVREPAAPRPRIGSGLHRVAAALRLAHQTDELRIGAHWVKADMGEVEFRSLLTGDDGDSGGVGQNAGLDRRAPPGVAAFEREHTGAARRDLARLVLRSAAQHRQRPIVVLARNRIALQSLDRCPPGGRVALCWGVVHGPDFLAALRRRGYRVARTSWHRVFGFESGLE